MGQAVDKQISYDSADPFYDFIWSLINTDTASF